MKLTDSICLSVITLVASSFFVCPINSGRTSLLKYFNDVPDAINYMYRRLPRDMSLEDKCKKYAVLALDTTTYRDPNEGTADKVITMNDERLDRLYRAIDTNRLMKLFMTAIDRYRVTQLAPAFVDIVECLKMIDSPVARAFVDDDELALILDMYKRVLGRDDLEIDINRVDLAQFRQAYKLALENLFAAHYHIDTLNEPQIVRKKSNRTNQQAGSSSEDPKRGLSSDKVSFRRRERSRLDQRRKRFLEPESIRDKDRRNQRAHRARIKRYNAELYLPATNPEAKRARRAPLESRYLRQRQLQQRKQIEEEWRRQREVRRLQQQEQPLMQRSVSDMVPVWQSQHEGRFKKPLYVQSLSAGMVAPQTDISLRIDPTPVPNLPTQDAIRPDDPPGLDGEQLDMDQFINNLIQFPLSPPPTILESDPLTYDDPSSKPTDGCELSNEQHQVSNGQSTRPDTIDDRPVHQDPLDTPAETDDMDAIMQMIAYSPDDHDSDNP